MIVQCPSCASRYRIRDANIPPSGGKIRCPSCSHAFIVYPEANDDEDKTNITSQGEISQLINKMGDRDQASLGAHDEDYVSTQIATSDEARAAAARASELGDPMDMDGTVEIQNPMKVWKQAQDAMRATQQQQQQQASQPAAADDDEDDDEWDDFAATEVVDPSKLNFAQIAQSQQQQAVLPPTTEVSREELADAFGVAATSGMFASVPKADQAPQQRQPPQQQDYPSAYDSGASVDDYGSGQYAPNTPNTPPGGRSTHESWEQMQPPTNTEPHEQVNAFAHQQQQQQQQQQSEYPPTQPQQQQQQWGGHQSGFNRSPSGLTSAALFDDPIPDDDPVNSDIGMSSPFGDPAAFGGPPQQQQQQYPPQQQQYAPQEAPQAGGAPDHPGPWKLKTNFGLTYEFPDTKGLRSWLSSREELDGFTVSADDGASFHALGAFPQLSSGRTASTSGVGMQPRSHGSGTFQQPQGYNMGLGDGPSQGFGPTGPDAFGSGLNSLSEPSSSQIKGPRINNEYRPPSRESKGRGLLWLVFLLLLAAAVVIGLETTGVFKISDLARDLGILPAEQATNQNPEVNDAPDGTDEAPVIDPEKLAEKQAADVEALLEDTERLVEGNKLPAALDRLNKLEQLAPENPLVFDLRAQVLDKLGKAEEAEADRQTAAELRGEGVGPDAGTAEPGDEPSDNPK